MSSKYIAEVEVFSLILKSSFIILPTVVTVSDAECELNCCVIKKENIEHEF